MHLLILIHIWLAHVLLPHLEPRFKKLVLQKPCFVIANYINDVIDYQAIKDCSGHPQNYKGFNYFNDDFDKRIIDFVSENNKIKKTKTLTINRTI